VRRPCGTDFKSRIRWRFGSRQSLVLAKSFYPERAFERCARSEATKRKSRHGPDPLCLALRTYCLTSGAPNQWTDKSLTRPLRQVASRRAHPTTSLSGNCNEVVIRSSQFAVRSSQFAVRSSQFAVRSSQFAKEFCDSTTDYKCLSQIDLSALTQ
jgi:hypothetical protein